MRRRRHGSKPDLVDRVELTARLGVAGATIDRWHRRAVLPEPDYRFRAGDVWLWDTVSEWAGGRSRFRKRSRPLPDVVDLHELAGRLGLGAHHVASWQRNGFLPEPDYRWQALDAWLWDTIEAWQHTAPTGPMARQIPPDPLTLRGHEPGDPRSGPAGGEGGSGPSEGAPPAAGITADTAVDVTPAAPRDPLREMEQIRKYFGAMASEFAGDGPD